MLGLVYRLYKEDDLMVTRLILVRHAVTDANVRDKFLGMTDISLSELGFNQAKVLGERIANEYSLNALYTSSMKRTRETADAILIHQNVPMFSSNKLIELDFGEWEGRTHAEVAFRYPYEFVLWTKRQQLAKHINGETIQDLKQRLIEEVTKIAKIHQGETVCIVTHGACIKVLMSHFEGVDIDNINTIPWCDNTGITVIEIKDGEYAIKARCDANHLNGELMAGTYKNIGLLIEGAKKRIKPKRRYEFIGA